MLVLTADLQKNLVDFAFVMGTYRWSADNVECYFA